MTKSNETVELKFQIVQAKEAKNWVRVMHYGRFVELKEKLLEVLPTLRGRQALTFQAPADPKEIKSVRNAVAHLFANHKMPYRLAYSSQKKLLIVFRKPIEKNGAK